MNVSVFGKIISSAGALVLTISLLSVYWTAPGITPEKQWYAWAREYAKPTVIHRRGRNPGSYDDYVAEQRASQMRHAACAYSQFGRRSCPIGGYSAIFTYIGAFFLLIGGGLIIASRQPPTQQAAKD